MGKTYAWGSSVGLTAPRSYFLGQHAVIHAMNPSISDFRIACIRYSVCHCGASPLTHSCAYSKTLEQAILTVAISRKLFSTHVRQPEFTLTVNQAKRIQISKDNMDSEIRAYSGNPDVRLSLFFLFSFPGGCGSGLRLWRRNPWCTQRSGPSNDAWVRLSDASHHRSKILLGGDHTL